MWFTAELRNSSNNFLRLSSSFIVSVAQEYQSITEKKDYAEAHGLSLPLPVQEFPMTAIILDSPSLSQFTIIIDFFFFTSYLN